MEAITKLSRDNEMIFDEKEASILQYLPNLKELNLSNNDIIPAGLIEATEACPLLEVLILDHTTSFGEFVFAAISSLKLKTLSANDSLIEPSAVPWFINMKMLTTLELRGSKPIAATDIDVIRKQRPGLQIDL